LPPKNIIHNRTVAKKVRSDGIVMETNSCIVVETLGVFHFLYTYSKQGVDYVVHLCMCTWMCAPTHTHTHTHKHTHTHMHTHTCTHTYLWVPIDQPSAKYNLQEKMMKV